MMARRTTTVEFAFVLLAVGLGCSAGQRAGQEGLCDASSGAEGCGPPPKSSDSVYEHPERSDLATLLQVKITQGDRRGSGLAQAEDQDIRDAALIGANVGSERRLLTKRDGFSSGECTEKKWKSGSVCPLLKYNGWRKTGTAKKCAEFCDTKSGTRKVGDIAPSFSQSVDAFDFSFNKKNGNCRCCFKGAEYVPDKAWDSWKCKADPVPCSLSGWSDWTVCSQSCGGGARGRSRHVTKAAKYNGACDEDMEESEACDTTPCPTDCELSEWEDWGPCSVSCGDGGTRARSRFVSTSAQHGGKPCGGTEEKEECSATECPVPTDWTIVMTWPRRPSKWLAPRLTTYPNPDRNTQRCLLKLPQKTTPFGVYSCNDMMIKTYYDIGSSYYNFTIFLKDVDPKGMTYLTVVTKDDVLASDASVKVLHGDEPVAEFHIGDPNVTIKKRRFWNVFALDARISKVIACPVLPAGGRGAAWQPLNENHPQVDREC